MSISSRYQTITISGSVSGNTNSNGNNPGLIFVPYIMVQEIDKKLLIEIKRKDRKEKLNKIYKNNNTL